MPVDVRVGVQLYVAEYLHPDDGVDEKQHADQQTNVGQCLEKRTRTISRCGGAIPRLAGTRKRYATKGPDESQYNKVQQVYYQGTHFERLDERPKQYSYRVPLSQQFYQSRGSEQTEKSDVYEVFLQQRGFVYNA